MAKPADGIWIIDAEARTTYLNDRMAEILGAVPSEIMGQDSLAFVFPEDLAQAQQLFANKKAGNTLPFRFRLRQKDGSPVWVDVQGTPMFNAAGEFLGIVGTFTALDTEPRTTALLARF